MQVGIITIHNHYNYGATLQAFALNRTVRMLGHQCQTIDCDIEPGIGRQLSWAKHPGEQIKNLYLICRLRENRRFEKRFLSFSRHHIPLTDVKYDSLDQLVASPPKFDAYITGSDQVWFPMNLDKRYGHAFHLCFADPENSRLIAYAPSFGVANIPEKYHEHIRNYLMRYHSLSVREKRGQRIIFELTGRRAEHVLDPTLLLSAEEYDEVLEHPTISGEYILVYPMELGVNMGFLTLVKEIKKHLSSGCICVSSRI